MRSSESGERNASEVTIYQEQIFPDMEESL